MVILVDGVRYRLSLPENEAALEKRIEDNQKQIFGEHSFYFPKKLIRSKAGIGTIPDAFVIYFDRKPKWAVIEVELASHSVYEHVFPQLTKFKRALDSHTSRRKIADFFYERIKADAVLEATIKKQIGSGEVFKFFSDLVADDPMIAVIIDNRTEQLDEALMDFGREVKVVEFKTFRREGLTDEINAYFFEPIVNQIKKTIATNIHTTAEVIPSIKINQQGIGKAIHALFDDKGMENVSYEECEAVARRIKSNTAFNKGHFSWYKNDYKKRNGATSASDITKNAGSHILPAGLQIRNTYKGVEFTAKVLEGGRIRFNGEVFNSPSWAAVAAIQSTGSNRETENGWKWWKYTDSDTGEEIVLDALRNR